MPPLWAARTPAPRHRAHRKASSTPQGVLTVADPDQNQSLFAAGTVGGSYGNLVIDEAGNWTYTALANHPAIAPLTDGETLIDVVTVTTYDGTTHDVSITISGSNEAPVAFDNTKTVAENEATAQAGNVILDDDGLGWTRMQTAIR
jgi:VCBS repeat-containing protein